MREGGLMGLERTETGGPDLWRGGAIDLPQLFRAIVRARRWIIIPTLMCFLGALAVVAVVHPRYTGVAKVLLENQENYYTRPDKAAADQAQTLDPEAVQSLAETIISTELAAKAVARLDLTSRDEFNPTALSNPLSMALAMIGLGPNVSAQTIGERTADAFLSHLTVYPLPRSRVLQIEFVSQDPALAARGANTVAQLFLGSQEDAKKAAAKNASGWLSDRIDELRGKVAAADAKVENFRAQSGLLAGANSMTLPGQQLSDINTQLAAAKAAQSAAGSKAKMLSTMMRDGRLDEIPDAAKDESLRRYAEQRVTLKAQIALESQTLLPGHPRMKELNAQLAGLDREMRLAANKVVQGLDNEARLDAAQVDGLNAALARKSTTVAAGNVDDVQLRALELEAKAARDQLESYLQKYREATARDADNSSPADARIIATATEPRTPTFPKKIETLTLGTLAGLLLSVGIVVAWVLLLGGEAAEASGSRLVEAPSGATMEPVSAALVDEATPLDAFGSAEELTEHIAGLEAPLIAMIVAEASPQALAASLEVTRKLASRGRAVLIDLGQTDGWLDDALEAGEEKPGSISGLAELLAGEVDFADALRRDAASGLDILPAGLGDIAPEGLDEAINVLAAAYDFIVIHTPDWRTEAALAALDFASELVLIARPDPLRRAMTEAAEILAAVPVAVRGLAMPADSAIERAA
jgi:succinoglycan biosynthesis transport protein ExoP